VSAAPAKRPFGPNGRRRCRPTRLPGCCAKAPPRAVGDSRPSRPGLTHRKSDTLARCDSRIALTFRSMRSSGLEPPRALQPTRPSTGYAGRRCVLGRPDRPFGALFWTYWTHLAAWMFSKCSHVPAAEDRAAAGAGSPSKPLRFCSDGIAGGIRRP
jgi:hypothetical protein